ncbi:MAG: sulfatase [Actinomycetota bacterium]
MRTLRCLLVCVLGALVLVPSVAAAAEPPAGQQPDVVVILTDDQRVEAYSRRVMPVVARQIVAKGTSFSNAFVSNPLCCPSRASILTGQYSHTTNVYANGGQFGGFPWFTDTSTIATWLDDAGYRTGLVGKYLNQYKGPYVPPGWDRWVAFQKHGYYDYSLVVDGTLTAFGTTEAEYATDVLSSEAEAFVRDTPAEDPLFLYFAPYAPHEPATPAPRHQTLFSGTQPWRPPSYNEGKIGDKPEHIRTLSRLLGERRASLDALRIDQLRSLRAVDEGVERIVSALRETGRLKNTVLVFLSDNGYLWGEHRWDRKVVPYEESIRVPMAMRYDPITGGVARVDDRIVMNIDVAPTIADLVGVPAPGVEGLSAAALLGGGPTAWRSDFLLEHDAFGNTNSVVPAYCGVRNEDYVYVEYLTGEMELYDLAADPFQLRNVAGRGAYASIRAELDGRLEVLCDPPPPAFRLPEVEP